MLAKIFVTPKKSVLDPQGEAVRKAIHSLGMECVESARIGKYIELEISGSDAAKTREKLEGICHELLSNPVIEDYELVLEGAPAAKPATPAPVPAAKKDDEKSAKKPSKEPKSARDLKSTAQDKSAKKKKK